MSLATPDGIQELQRKLHRKAKEDPKYRFYSLIDKVYRPDVLKYAYRLCRSKKGAAGVDGQTFEDIEAYGEERFLKEVEHELVTDTYRPEAVRRVMIPKENGGERPLGIPTVKDRTVQTAAKLVLEPIFEADFTDNAHGYRPGHSARAAVEEVHRHLREGYTDVVDADLSRYFDTIPHDQLLKSVARRVSDGRMLHLIKMWLSAPIEEKDDEGRPQRRNPGSHGTPQGGVISPLLANIYMRRFLLAWARRPESQWRARIVNYADDFVICCRGTARQSLSTARDLLTRIGLTLNEVKTRVCEVWKQSFDFLGYTFGVNYAPKTAKPYLGVRPSTKRLVRLRTKLHEMTERSTLTRESSELIGSINRVTRGWTNYFSYGTLSRAYGAVDAYVRRRVRQWLVRKHKGTTRGTRRYSDQVLEGMGLLNLRRQLAALRKPSA